MKQVLNLQEGVSGTHSFKAIDTQIASIVTSWRRESRNIDLVILDKLLFIFPLRESLVVLDKLLLYYSQNLSFEKKIEKRGQTDST